MAASGVLSSWLMLATNWFLCWLAISRSSTVLASSRVRAWASSNRRVFSIAITAWSAKVLTPERSKRHTHRTGALRTRPAHRAVTPALETFQQGLRELGYVEGQTIVLEVRSAEGRSERLPELVAELVGLKVEVLVAQSTPAALAAKNATQTIPIVMMATDPVALGLVGSLSRPGGNVTGLSYFSEAIMGKRLELLKEVVPGLARVGVLRNPLHPADPIYW